MTRAVASFETDAWNKIVGGDAAEAGTGAGSYDIRKTVWHVNVSLFMMICVYASNYFDSAVLLS